MDYHDVVSAYSDGTHSLQRIHWRFNAEFLQICSVEEQTYLGWPEAEYIELIIICIIIN